LEVSRSHDQMIHWDCKAVGNTSPKTEMNAGVMTLNLDGLNLAKCTLSLPDGTASEFTGVNGHIVDDAAGLTRALETMLALPPVERAAMGARGRERVLRDFTAARFVRDVEQTYRECLA